MNETEAREVLRDMMLKGQAYVKATPDEAELLRAMIADELAARSSDLPPTITGD